jgi:hypothetical protein
MPTWTALRAGEGIQKLGYDHGRRNSGEWGFSERRYSSADGVTALGRRDAAARLARRASRACCTFASTEASNAKLSRTVQQFLHTPKVAEVSHRLKDVIDVSAGPNIDLTRDDPPVEPLSSTHETGRLFEPGIECGHHDWCGWANLAIARSFSESQLRTRRWHTNGQDE